MEAAGGATQSPTPMVGIRYSLNWGGGELDLLLTSSILGRGDRQPWLYCAPDLHIHHLHADGRHRRCEMVGLPRRAYEASSLLSPYGGAADASFADVTRTMRWRGVPEAALEVVVEKVLLYLRHVAAWAVRPGARREPPLETGVDAVVHVRMISEEDESSEEEEGVEENLPSMSAAVVPEDKAGMEGQREGSGGGKEEEGEECCPICLERMAGRERRWLPCAHSFHGVCVERWLRRKARCPLCRLEVTMQRD